MNKDWLLCGFKVRSDLPLTDLPVWEGDARPPDLTISSGRVSTPLIEPEILWHGNVQVSREGNCFFFVPPIATYCVDVTGRSIVIDLAPGAAISEVQDFLFGTVLVILCQRRRLWPLHASCVRLGDNAVAFTGPSGSGKSTLVAAFLAQGYEILADDVTVVDLVPGKGAMVLPSVPRIKLWNKTAIELGLSVATSSTERLHKERLPLGLGFSSISLPLTTIYYIEPLLTNDAFRIFPVRGMDAVHEICKATHRRPLMKDLSGGPIAFLENAMRVAAAIPGHSRLERVAGISLLPDMVAFIAEKERSHCA